VILAVDEKEIPEGIELSDTVLERQLSYFSDVEGKDGMIWYLGDSPWAQLIAMLAADFNADNPRRRLHYGRKLNLTSRILSYR
jgi:hypothetical protein